MVAARAGAWFLDAVPTQLYQGSRSKILVTSWDALILSEVTNIDRPYLQRHQHWETTKLSSIWSHTIRPSASRHHRTSLGCAPSPPLRWHCDLEVGTFMRTGNFRRYSNHSWHVHGQAIISCENTSTHHQFIHFTQFITMLSDSFWSNQIYIILAAGEDRRPTGSQPAPTDIMKLDLTRFWNQALVLPAFDRNQVALSRVHLLCLDLRPPAFWCALGRKILA